MASRGRGGRRQAFEVVRQGYPAPSAGPLVRGPFHQPLHPAVLEEELELQMMDLRRFSADNRGLAEDRAAFHRELAAAKEELNRMNLVIAEIQAEKEAHTRDMIEKRSRLEADLRATEPLREEVIELRADNKKLTAIRQELNDQVRSLSHDLTRAQSDNQQIPAMKAEIDGLHQELMHLWMSIEYEKKSNFELMEQRQSMEKNLVSIAHEIEKLHTDLASTEGRPQAASGSYGDKLGSSDGPYSSTYGYEYGNKPPVTDKTNLYGAGSGSWGALNNTHLARHREFSSLGC